MRVVVLLTFAIFMLWVSNRFGYVVGFRDGLGWCLEVYQQNNMEAK